MSNQPNLNHAGAIARVRILVAKSADGYIASRTPPGCPILGAANFFRGHAAAPNASPLFFWRDHLWRPEVWVWQTTWEILRSLGGSVYEIHSQTGLRPRVRFEGWDESQVAEMRRIVGGM